MSWVACHMESRQSRYHSNNIYFALFIDGLLYFCFELINDSGNDCGDDDDRTTWKMNCCHDLFLRTHPGFPWCESTSQLYKECPGPGVSTPHWPPASPCPPPPPCCCCCCWWPPPTPGPSHRTCSRTSETSSAAAGRGELSLVSWPQY